jgi:hypothetical protein
MQAKTSKEKKDPIEKTKENIQSTSDKVKINLFNTYNIYKKYKKTKKNNSYHQKLMM